MNQRYGTKKVKISSESRKFLTLIKKNCFIFCKISKEIGYEGFVGFDAKTLLIEHYNKTLGAERAIGQRMFISNTNADILINQYFKIK